MCRRISQEEHTSAHSKRQTPTQTLLAVLNGAMHLVHHVFEVLGLEIAEDLHCGAFYLFDVADGGCATVVNGDDAGHEFVVIQLVLFVHFLEEVVDLEDAVVDDLDAVVEVGELVLLAADGARDGVLQHAWDAVLGGGGARSLVLLLSVVDLLPVCLLRGEVLLLLVLFGVGVALLIGLFARERVCGGDAELVDFEGVGVLSAGGAYTKVIAFGEFDLVVVRVDTSVWES